MTEDTRRELECTITKYEGHSRMIVVAALKAAGVDIRIYSSGIMYGNHCMKFAEKGEDIMSKITEDMLALDSIKKMLF